MINTILRENEKITNSMRRKNARGHRSQAA